jgi:hypothetical protein
MARAFMKAPMSASTPPTQAWTFSKKNRASKRGFLIFQFFIKKTRTHAKCRPAYALNAFRRLRVQE